MHPNKTGFWQALLKAAPLIIISAITTVLIHDLGWLRSFENSAIDSLVKLRPVTAEHVFVVGITDSDYASLFHEQSPLDPKKVCELVRAIAAGQPKVIVVDLDTSNSNYQNVSMPDNPPTIWALGVNSPRDKPTLQLNDRSETNSEDIAIAGKVLGVSSNDKVQSGIAAFPRDNDGIIRWYARYARIGKNETNRSAEVELKPTVIWSAVTAFRGGSPTVPPTDEKFLLAPTSRSDYVPRISAGDMLQISQTSGWKDLVADKIVLLGGYYENARDTYFIGDGKIQGVELQAQAIESELQTGGTPKANPWLLLAAQLLASIAFVAINHFLPGFRGLLLGFLFVPIAAIGLSILLFSSSYLWFDFVPIMLTVQLLFLYGHIHGIIQQNQELLRVNRELLNTRHELATAVDRGAELERKRLAQELHDDTLGKLFQISVYLQPYAGSDTDGGKLAKGLSTVHTAMANIRAIMMNLYPPVLDKFGLGAAIKELAANQSDDAIKVEATIEPSTLLENFPQEKQLAIYRIVQEGLNNARKHSGARKITINARSHDGKVLLSVIDNGNGMNSEDATDSITNLATKSSYGLHGIRTKASLLGAEVRWISPPPGMESGTQLNVELPLGQYSRIPSSETDVGF